MANEFQDSIFKAIDTLLDKRVENLDLDKTITATIDTCANLLENMYVINYQGGKTYAYAQSGATYTKDQRVYVLVPEGDFTKKKIIIGKASIVSEKEQNTYVSSILNDYNLVGSNVLDDKGQRFGLHSYRSEDYIVLYDSNQKDNIINIDVDSLETYFKEASAITVRAKFNTADLPREHRQSAKGNYGLIFNMVFRDRSGGPVSEDDWDATDEDETVYTKNVTYVLDTNNMTGNPFQYNTDITQYEVFPFDTDNFIRIESIYAFCEDFVETTDEKNDKLYGPTIYIKDIELYGLKEISSEFNGYKLRISTPKGSIFKDDTNDNSTLEVKADLVYQDYMSLSDKASFFWFREDARISSTSPSYNVYGGAGWSYLSTETFNVNTYLSSKKNNKAYENNYLCVCVYEEQVVLKAYFTLYNDSNKRIIEIDASPAKKFSFDRGEVNLTCKMKMKPEDPDFIDDFTSDALSIYSFYWTKLNPGGEDTVFNMTVADIDKAIAEENAKENPSMSTLVSLRNKKASLAGISWDKNRLTYPVKGIETSATFKCSVYKRENNVDYMIGSATITIENEDAAEPTDYYIIIENGDQVFQYSESGVSPCDERYKDPLQVFNLKCHFIDPAGLEVRNTTYSLKWKFPTESTMLVKPTENTMVNPSNGIVEWLSSIEYPIKIADNYDYQALNNQIQAIVTYNGVEYTKDTNFLFVKVGDNGTNGTDIVAKIDIPSKVDDEMPFIQMDVSADDKYSNIKWSDGSTLSSKTLNATLYQRNQSVDTGVTVTWDISGKQNLSKRMGISNGVISYEETDRKNTVYSNQIVKATFRYVNEGTDVNTYYAFAGIPTVLYKNSDITVKIEKRRTLKDILYNSDGRNPMYNKNQGVFITLWKNGAQVTDKTVKWKVVGGINDLNNNKNNNNNKNDNSADITIMSAKDDRTTSSLAIDLPYDAEDKAYRVYVLPNDVYNGANCNNMVVAEIDDAVEIRVPIHMSLNTFGLASLNQWDGNHVEINEDSNYIMAPQIGAGLKDNNNRFTGVVMGTAQTYDQQDPQVGLLGYVKGEQSMFLDAEDGSASFGLPPVDVRISEDFDKALAELEQNKPTEILDEPDAPIEPPEDASQEEKDEYEEELRVYNELLSAYRQNEREWEAYWSEYYRLLYDKDNYNGGYRYQEGRIELNPGGESLIGNWRIGSDFLYNIVGGSGESADRNKLDEPYSDLKKLNRYISNQIDMYKGSIPNDAWGIQLNSNPSYISVKGRKMIDEVTYTHMDTYVTSDGVTLENVEVPVLDKDGNIETKSNGYDITSVSGNNIIYDGDTFELELNPNTSSLFTIYRHTQNNDDISRQYSVKGIPVLQRTGEWRREPKVGIDNAGRFYTNSLKDEGAALTLNELPAFGQNTATASYRGINIEIGKSPLDTVPMIKLFAESSELAKNVRTAPVYISGGSEVENEYIRPLGIYGKTISLYSSGSKSTSKTTDHKLILTDNLASFGHYKDGNQAYLELNPESNDSISKLFTNKNLNISCDRDYTSTIGGNRTISIDGINNITVEDNTTITENGDISIIQPNSKVFRFTNGEYNFNIIPNTEDKGFLLGNDDDHIHLKGSGSKYLEMKTTSSRLKLWGNKSSISIISEDNAEGIKLQAKYNGTDGEYSTNVNEGHASLVMIPNGTGGNGYIGIITDDGQAKIGGSIASFDFGNNEVKADITGVIMTPGIGSNFAYLSGTFTGDGNSTTGERPTVSITKDKLDNTSLLLQKDLRILDGWAYAPRFVSDVLSCGTLSMKDSDNDQNPKNMGKGWFEAIQYFWDGDKPAHYRGYARQDDLDTLSKDLAALSKSISNAGYATKKDLQNTENKVPSLSELRNIGSKLSGAVVGATEISTIVGALANLGTALYNIPDAT